jgi:hypothetical protein
MSSGVDTVCVKLFFFIIFYSENRLCGAIESRENI